MTYVALGGDPFLPNAPITRHSFINNDSGRELMSINITIVILN